ncbi:DUF885 family protein [Micromonospora inaquosa]|uniref:DUF885 family protein n=1 Tax=Micromonospora inaquosa TaxID=2203716 RepID=UPI003CC680A8
MPSGDGAAWTPDAALELLRDRCHQGPYASAELGRYLGRPGQALAYKVGERAWLAGRSSFPGDHAHSIVTRWSWVRWAWIS